MITTRHDILALRSMQGIETLENKLSFSFTPEERTTCMYLLLILASFNEANTFKLVMTIMNQINKFYLKHGKMGEGFIC